MRLARLLLPLLLLPFLMGCKVSLYSGLQEKDATQMMALLMEQGVACEKLKAKDGWDLMVEKSELPAAVRTLAREGFPRHDYQNIGEVFGNKGLISSPQEDRIRYIFALSQEIAESISEIDGVLSARVHLVLPENDPLNDSLSPSSASVFVKYEPKSQVRQNVTQIKHLVLNGVEGLTVDKVSVVTVPAAAAAAALPAPTYSLLGVRLYRDGAATLLWSLLGAVPLLLVLGYFAGTLLAKRKPMALVRRKGGVPAPAANGLANL